MAKPPRFRPSKESLKIAADMAAYFEADFDPEETRAFADRLHETYFAQICRVLDKPRDNYDFESGAYRKVNAFAAPSGTVDPDGKPLIGLDEQLDFWLMTLTGLTTVAACIQLDGPQHKRLVDLFVRNLRMVRNPYQFETLRELEHEFLLKYKECAELYHAFSRSMLVFILCHELAHADLGHLAMGTNPAHELEADALAAEYFLKIAATDEQVEGGEAIGPYIYVSPKLVCAPLLLVRFFDLEDKLVEIDTGRPRERSAHPSPAQRLDALAERLEPELNERSKYILDGFTKALDDIARLGGITVQ